MDQISIRD